jgi:hypothetical protein
VITTRMRFIRRSVLEGRRAAAVAAANPIATIAGPRGGAASKFIDTKRDRHHRCQHDGPRVRSSAPDRAVRVAISMQPLTKW